MQPAIRQGIQDARNSTPLRVVLSLIVVWCIAYLGPSRDFLSSRIAAQVSKLPTVVIDFHPEKSPRERYNGEKLGLLIEAQPMGQIAPLLLHMMAVAPQDWPFTFIGTSESVEFVNRSNAIREYQANGKLLVMEAPPQLDRLDYEGIQRILTMPWFYDNVIPGVEFLFHFGVDSILCANSAASLDDWLDYDWIGPPWQDYNHLQSSGGFSLRKVSQIRRVLSFQERTNDTEGEDDFMTGRLQLLPDANMASSSEAERFAVERVWYPEPMGYKIGDMPANLEQVWDEEEHRNQMWEYCPELKMIMKMKLTRERCDGEAHGQDG